MPAQRRLARPGDPLARAQAPAPAPAGQQSAEQLAEQLHTVLGRLGDESAALADALRAGLEECTDDALQHVRLLERASVSVKVPHELRAYGG